MTARRGDPSREAKSPALKPRLPFIDERLGRLPMVGCEAGVQVMGYLEVHALLEAAVHGPVEVLLHVPVGH